MVNFAPKSRLPLNVAKQKDFMRQSTQEHTLGAGRPVGGGPVDTCLVVVDIVVVADCVVLGLLVENAVVE